MRAYHQVGYCSLCFFCLSCMGERLRGLTVLSVYESLEKNHIVHIDFSTWSVVQAQLQLYLFVSETLVIESLLLYFF